MGFNNLIKYHRGKECGVKIIIIRKMEKHEIKTYLMFAYRSIVTIILQQLLSFSSYRHVTLVTIYKFKRRTKTLIDLL
jgi:hypothetical protein